MSKLCDHLGLIRHCKSGKSLSQRRNQTKLDIHSRTVLIGKISLFTSAVLLSVGIFIIAKSNGTPNLQGVGGIQLPSDDRTITRPNSVGLTRSGLSYQIIAERGFKEIEPTGRAYNLLEDLTITLKNRLVIQSEIRSNTGRLNADHSEVSLVGEVRGMNADGYQIRSEGLFANLNTETAHSIGPVQVIGPQLTLQSNNLYITFSKNNETYIFTSGVHVTYIPEPSEQ